MATIEDLETTSIVDISQDEGIELLRQIRLSRRTQKKKKSKSTKAKISQTKKSSGISKGQAIELLKILEGIK